MAMRLSFDVLGNVELPTLVLARRNGEKIGELSNLSNVIIRGDMSKPEISFTIHKYDGDEITPYWESVKDFKLVWCKEWDLWFEMKINSTYSDEVSKSATLIILGYAELSETKIYGMEVNTEEDILRDDYIQPTLFYNADKPEASLMHRLLDKTPHYTIGHIDEHLKGIQRVFSFNDKKLAECFDEIAQELDILFVYDSNSTESNRPNRTVSVYDLKSYCKACGARGSFVGQCLNCGSYDISEGYGEDTTIFVSTDGLGEEINVEVNQDEVKNCFRLEGGDDLMTATIRNCNPNGTNYIWEPGTNVEDMDVELQQLLEDYKELFNEYRDTRKTRLSSLSISNYNAVVTKYKDASEDISPTTIPQELVGYSPIMQYYYDTIDLEVFLQSGLLPSLVLQDTTAVDEAKKLTATKLSPVAVADAKYITLANAATAVLNAAKIAADPRYKITVKQSSLSGNTWTGNFTVTNFSDERDTWNSEVIRVTVNDDYETYVKQKLRKSLYNGTKGKYGSVAQMIDMNISDFKAQLKKYNLVALNSINTCFTECLNILAEQGVDKAGSELYTAVYTPISSKIGYIQEEVVLRESEINIVRNMQNKLLELKQNINNILNLENYLGDYWMDFCAYRREETFSNTNYISDYLTNKQLFDLANEFLDLADYELHKVATYTHEITSTLKNLLVMPEFKPLLCYFECGNWIRVQDDDGKTYKLRLLNYEIDFDNLKTLSVTFSDASRTIDGLAPIKEILVKSSNIINNYNAAMNKTNSNFESINDSMKDCIVDTGFNNEYIYDSYYDAMNSLAQTEKKVTTSIIAVDGLIRTEISDRTKAEDDIRETFTSSITQTAKDIRAEAARTYETIGNVTTKVGEALVTAKGYADSRIKISSDSITATVSERINATVDYIDDALEDYTTTIDMQTMINQSANDITFTALANYYTKTDIDRQMASITITPDMIESKVSRDDVVSVINQSAEQITLTSGRLVITSGNFQLKSNGDCIMSGTVNASGGTIGNFTISTMSGDSTNSTGIYGGGVRVHPYYGIISDAGGCYFKTAVGSIDLTVGDRNLNQKIAGISGAMNGVTYLYGTIDFDSLSDSTIAYLNTVITGSGGSSGSGTTGNLSNYVTKTYLNQTLTGYVTNSTLSYYATTAVTNSLASRITALEGGSSGGSSGGTSSGGSVDLSDYATTYWVGTNFITQSQYGVDIPNIREDISDIKTTYATGSQLATQAGRISALEQEVSSLSSTVSTNTDYISSFTSSIGSLGARVRVLEEQLAALQ